MNPCGACAPPPRGPRPSTVSGIEGAKWLASLAPPRRAPTIGGAVAPLACSSRPADRPARLLEQTAGPLARVHARPLAHERRAQPRAADLGRHRPDDRAQRV